MNLSLRGRIVLATLLPLTLFGGLAIAVGVRALTATAEDLALQRQTALTKVAAAGLAANLQAGVRTLDLTARELGDLADRPLEQQTLLLSRSASLSGFTSVVLVDGEGRAVAIVPPGTPTAGFEFARQPFFREARAVQSAAFSGVFRYTPTGQLVTAVAVPVRSRGVFSGMLVAGYSLARPEWARDLNLVRSPNGSIAYLVDGEGTVIYRPGSTTMGETIQSDPERWRLASQHSPAGTILRPAGNGEEVVATFAPVAGTGWGLFTEEPWQPIIASVLPVQLLVAGIMGLGIVFALFALLISLNRATGPLAALVDEGQRVAEGKPFRPLTESGPPDLRILLRAVNQMVSRLENQQQALRNYAAEVIRAQEDERLRLSRELHDGAVQDLVALGQRLELCRDAIQAGDPTAKDRLEDVQALAHKSVVELRRMSNYLRPSILEDLGLVPALRLVVREIGHHMPDTLTALEVVGEEVRLALETELTVFRVAQEAVSNVRKHACNASRVNVALVFEATEVTLVVEDNGPGFAVVDAGVLLKQGHLGLAGMEERARLLGGEVSVESEPGKGTTVLLRVPTASAPGDTRGATQAMST